MLTRCSFLSIALVLVACSPTLDGSSDESFEASLERVRQAIPEARRAAFDTAMITVGLSDFDLLGGVFTEAASPGQLSRKWLKGYIEWWYETSGLTKPERFRG